jgi:pyridoxal phosphate enzyme (YggS family)
LTEALNNFQTVQQRIKAAALRSGRNPAEIKLVIVTKTVPVERIVPIINAGGNNLGENRVQELEAKQMKLPQAEWHLIGHLQTNKAKKVVGNTVLIHSLDRWSLAKILNRLAIDQGIKANVLVQVNISGEESKYGLAPAEVADFMAATAELEGLNIAGLMTMAPYVNNPEEVRTIFKELYQMRQRLQVKWPNLKHLSMGMSNDFEVAVEEGADIVRVGSAIFRS